MTTNHPLRLAVGSHQAGSGQGCAMNVISWENGDTTITDTPDCADRMLARLVQKVNDGHCTHRDDDLLCPPCSVEVLALAHRTAGTAYHGLSVDVLCRAYVLIAVELAESVLPAWAEAYPNDDHPQKACEAARRWLNGPDDINAAANAAKAAKAADKAAFKAAANAAYAAANAAANAAYAATNAAYAANAANAADVPLIDVAHQVIDRFIELTGQPDWQPTLPTEQAIERMLDVKQEVSR